MKLREFARQGGSIFLVHMAAAVGNLDAVKLFVEFKVDVDFKKEHE